MTKVLRVSLKAGERIYVNGAVLKVDRKVSLEFLNDVTFLLEQHVMHLEDTGTPLRQLYFIAQTMLIEPARLDDNRSVFQEFHARVLASFVNPVIRRGLAEVATLVAADRIFEALKLIRAMLPIEQSILGGDKPAAPRPQSAILEAVS